MVALASVLVVVLVSLLITRVATLALVLTGMSRESARFQARSALSGVGFTTSEAERVVNHPIRRRIVLALMLVGSAGVVTTVASLIFSFGHASGGGKALRAGILVGGLFVIWVLSRSRFFDRALAWLIVPALHRAGLRHRDSAALVELEGNFAVQELAVMAEDWVAGRSLGELRLRDEGIAVLGVRRSKGTYIGVPDAATVIEAGDTLVLYARQDRVRELDDRRRGSEGDRAHRRAAADSERFSGSDSSAAPAPR
jgi:hypothetical protein